MMMWTVPAADSARLFVGGPLDGQWHDTQGRDVVLAPVPARASFCDPTGFPSVVETRTARYTRRVAWWNGGPVRVMLLDGLGERDPVVAARLNELNVAPQVSVSIIALRWQTYRVRVAQRRLERLQHAMRVAALGVPAWSDIAKVVSS